MGEGKGQEVAFETDGTNHPVCPFCGHEDYDWWDGLPSSSGDGYEWSHDCPSCTKTYKATLHVSTTFTTEEV